jgi:hypothetical protein
MIKKIFTAKMFPLVSSNLKEIGHQNGFGPNGEGVLRIMFKRGVSYDYWPVTNEEFLEGLAADNITNWFNKIKQSKQFSKVDDNI